MPKKSSTTLIEDAMRDTVVVTATCSAKKLTSGQKDENLWLGCTDGAGYDCVITGRQGQSPTSGAGFDQAYMGCGSGRGNGKMVGVRGVPPPAK